MKSLLTCFSMLLAIFSVTTYSLADTFGSGANQFTIDFVTIGNPGNVADTTGNPSRVGSVPDVYRMGQYEISRDMVTKASDAGNLGLTLDSMSRVTGGPRPAMPATGVSWNEAARFVNWLNTSQGFQAAYKFSTQPGDGGYNANASIELWQPVDVGYDPNNRFRNSLATYFLPDVDEWYKAAYFDPNANGGIGGYWDFPTGRDTVPLSVASGTDPGTAVYRQGLEPGPGLADITQAGGLSPYGVMGLGGNVSELEETEFDLRNLNGSSARGIRGGDWFGIFVISFNFLSVSSRFELDPTNEHGRNGFRVASVPEPSSLLLGALATIGLLMRRGLAG